MDEIGVNVEELNFLRSNTVLDPISATKVAIARRKAEKNREFYIRQNPTDIIEVDYGIAEELEYQFRKHAWIKANEKLWKEYIKYENDGYGLIDFAEDLLKKHLEEEKKKTI